MTSGLAAAEGGAEMDRRVVAPDRDGECVQLGGAMSMPAKRSVIATRPPMGGGHTPARPERSARPARVRRRLRRQRRAPRSPRATGGSCQLLLNHGRRCGAVDWSEITLDAQAEDAGQAVDSITGELQDGA
jgi:hypothetical protein